MRFHFRIGNTVFHFDSTLLYVIAGAVLAVVILAVYIDVLNASLRRGEAFRQSHRLGATPLVSTKPDAQGRTDKVGDFALVSK